MMDMDSSDASIGVRNLVVSCRKMFKVREMEARPEILALPSTSTGAAPSSTSGKAWKLPPHPQAGTMAAQSNEEQVKKVC